MAYIIIIAVGIILDKITKIIATGYLKDQKDFVIIKDFFSFSYLENRGAAFGIFNNSTVILGIISLVFSVGLLIYLFKTKEKEKLYKVALAMIISGAIGNGYERLFNGYVVDFIMFHYKDVYYFPTFNVADMLVVIGAFLLAILIYRSDDGKK